MRFIVCALLLKTLPARKPREEPPERRLLETSNAKMLFTLKKAIKPGSNSGFQMSKHHKFLSNIMTKTCPNFFAFPIFHNGKWPTSVTQTEFLKTYPIDLFKNS